KGRREVGMQAGKGWRGGDDDVKALAGCGARGCRGKYLSAAEGAALGDIVAPRGALGEPQGGLGAVDAEHGGGARAGRGDREPAAIGIEIDDPRAVGQPGDKGAVVALVVKPAGLLAGQHISLVEGAVLLERRRAVDLPGGDARLGWQTFERARRAIVTQYDRFGVQHLLQRIEDKRHLALDAGGIGLHDEHRAEPVDDQAWKPIRLGMDKPVIGRAVDPLAQTQSSFEMSYKNPLSARALGVG